MKFNTDQCEFNDFLILNKETTEEVWHRISLALVTLAYFIHKLELQSWELIDSAEINIL